MRQSIDDAAVFEVFERASRLAVAPAVPAAEFPDPAASAIATAKLLLLLLGPVLVSPTMPSSKSISNLGAVLVSLKMPVRIIISDLWPVLISPTMSARIGVWGGVPKPEMLCKRCV